MQRARRLHAIPATKLDGVVAAALQAEFQLEMAFFQDPPTQYFEHIIEQRFRVALPPMAAITQGQGGVDRQLIGAQAAVAAQHVGQLFVAELLARDLREGLTEVREIGLRQAHPGGHRVAAEAGDQARMAGIHQRQRVTNMEAGNRARRAAQHVAVRLRRGEGNRGTVQAFFHFRCNKANHARMPIGIEQAGRVRGVDAVQLRFGHVLHLGLQGAAFVVDAVQDRRQFTRLPRIVGEQAFDADAHVFQSPCRVDAWADGKTNIGGGQGLGFAPCDLDQGPQAGAALPRTQPAQARTHQGAVVGIQRHHIGHRAHGD